MDEPPTLRIELLGDFRVLHTGEPVAGLDSARIQSLLAYLVLHQDAPQRRQQGGELRSRGSGPSGGPT